MITVVLGVGNWADQNGEYYRHFFVNTLLEHAFSTYQRQVVAPAGDQEIDGQKWTTDQDLYAMVKDGVAPQLTVVNDHLQVAGSIDPMSGVAVKTAKKPTEHSSGLLLPGGTDKKKTSFFSSVPLLVYLLVPILLVLVIGAIIISRGSHRRANRRAEASGSYSRSRRHRK